MFDMHVFNNTTAAPNVLKPIASIIKPIVNFNEYFILFYLKLQNTLRTQYPKNICLLHYAYSLQITRRTHIRCSHFFEIDILASTLRLT